MQTKPIYRNIRPQYGDKWITAFIILFVLITAFFLQTNSAFAARKSTNIPATGYCSNPESNGHCYATVDWSGPTPGAFTNLSPFGSMSCGSCGGFIDNEMWLSDTTDSQCVNDLDEGCWVEAGIEAISSADSYDCDPGITATCLFWADARPNGGGFHHHPGGIVGPDGTDLDLWYFFVTLRNNDNNNATGTNWSVDIQGYYNDGLVIDTSGLSTNNSMTAQDIIIGSELGSVNGAASAGQNDFQYNMWLGSSGSWSEQTNQTAFNGTNGPPNGWWIESPNSVTGGIWATSD